MEEPADWLEEPDDEAARRELPAGSFTGVIAGDARRSLDALAGEPAGVLVTGVVENSPAHAAGIEEGDLLLEVATPRERVALAWPSEWRRVELETSPGAEIAVRYDRAGVERETRLVAVARVRPAKREAAQRWREEERVGVVVRAATEVEARAAALGPGGGAVVVGLSADSPWRAAGVRYGDLIRVAAGAEIGHPEALLAAIRSAPAKGSIDLEIVRGGEIAWLSAPVSRRAGELASVSIPLVFSYERERGGTRVSALLGLLRWRRTPAAWDLRLLWLISASGGDADRLESVAP